MPPVTSYATPADLVQIGTGGSVFGATDVASAIEKSSRLMDSYFSRFTLPFIQVGADVTLHCVGIAVWLLYKAKGFNPEGDPAIRLAYEDAIRWLEQVAKGMLSPDVTDSSPNATPHEAVARAAVTSSGSRGWSSRGTGRGRGMFESD
jgi:phage gp36-like protein